MIKKILLCSAALALTITATMPTEVFAATVKDKEAVINYGEYFDETVYKTCTGATGNEGAVNAPLVGSDNQEKAFNFFLQKGLADYKAAGIIGNLIVESGGPQLDPKVKQFSGGPGRGIVQWEVGGRWDTGEVNMLKYARESGLDPLTLEAQLGFLWYELETTEKRAFTFVDGSKDVYEAAALFMTKFERPRDQSASAQRGRGDLAAGVLTRYGNGNLSPGGATTPSTSLLSSCAAAAVNGGDFTGQPGQTKQQGSGWTLNDNTDYAGTPCATGTTYTKLYQHPTRGFQIRLCKIKGMEIASVVSDKVVAMVTAADAAGISLDGGGFRSYEQQKQTRINNGCPNDSSPSGECSPPTAPPGSSEHERGLALDFSASGGSITKRSAQFKWLQANAANYGFVNLPSKSWHWSPSGY